ncbi:uncharacterized protein PODANS_0_250 [Podospora anserina S mat+]|uniref:Podospora anserina S mat+ genomic DNA chromosome 4, supercontig 2 n=1 Tax=Podospora anserina (strain S / ATCC MYA-4624 / DSM 980 / FGSC 10383) TaxID=515849 RepID=B2ADY3_PODAN|nr:uncharacterized protein PODANS_0_250 [Podospora anserina S mat+]CAP61648.1 unnamed protein product [Podospora anserina S mat+]
MCALFQQHYTIKIDFAREWKSVENKPHCIQLPANIVLDRGAANKSSSAWAEFSLYSQRNKSEEQSFVEICQGSIKAIFKRAESNGGEEGQQHDHDVKDLISSGYRQYTREIDHERLYERLTECGYEYGPIFQGIQHACLDGGGHAVGRVTICRGSTVLWQQDSTRHPSMRP